MLGRRNAADGNQQRAAAALGGDARGLFRDAEAALDCTAREVDDEDAFRLRRTRENGDALVIEGGWAMAPLGPGTSGVVC